MTDFIALLSSALAFLGIVVSILSIAMGLKRKKHYDEYLERKRHRNENRADESK